MHPNGTTVALRASLRQQGRDFSCFISPAFHAGLRCFTPTALAYAIGSPPPHRAKTQARRGPRSSGHHHPATPKSGASGTPVIGSSEEKHKVPPRLHCVETPRDDDGVERLRLFQGTVLPKPI